MQPFNSKTILTLLLAISAYSLSYLLFNSIHGFFAMTARSLFFIIIYGGGILVLKLSPDVIPVWNSLKKQLAIPYLRIRK
jgi:hypothetical protein